MSFPKTASPPAQTASFLTPDQKIKKRSLRVTDAHAFYKGFFDFHNITSPYITVKHIKPHLTKPGFILWVLDHELKYPDIFIEIVSEDLELKDTAPRRLYTIQGGKPFKERYGITTVKDSYLIPFDDLIEIPVAEFYQQHTHLQTQPTAAAEPLPAGVGELEPLTMEDVPYRECSLRDYFCMMHRTPFSNKSWLNELINRSNEWLTLNHQQHQLPPQRNR